MNRAVVAGIVMIVALSAVAYAFAAGGGDGSKDSAQTGPIATATVLPSPAATTPIATPSPQATPEPTASPDQSVSSTPANPGGTLPTQPPAPAATALPADRHAEPAPIDGLDVAVMESFPAQYMLQIKAGLPSGCALQYTHSVTRAGEVITVSVLNSLPNDAICTAIYGSYELNINLGSDFVAGQSYMVNVNDKQTTFTAQ